LVVDAVLEKLPEERYMTRLIRQLRNGQEKVRLPFWTFGEWLAAHPDMPEEEGPPSYESWLLTHWEAVRFLSKAGVSVRLVRPDGTETGAAVVEELAVHRSLVPVDAPLVAAAALCAVGGRPACVTVAVQAGGRIAREIAVWNAGGWMNAEDLLCRAERQLEDLGLPVAGGILLEGGDPVLLEACGCGCRDVLVRTAGPGDVVLAANRAWKEGGRHGDRRP
jgi:hypothetical protein